MMRDHFLNPVGLLCGVAAAEAVQQGAAGQLAGGDIAFQQLQLVQRSAGKITKTLHSYQNLRSSTDTSIIDCLRLLEQQRILPVKPRVSGPLLMGVVNVTPDSFSDGGDFLNGQRAIEHGIQLAQEGADILDIGGESTRPGAEPVSQAEELARILPVVEGLKPVSLPLSVDTRKPAIMRAAASGGAHVFNDVSALTYHNDSLKTACDLGLPIVLMHAQGDPRTMQDEPEYEDVLLDVFGWLAARIEVAEAAGIERANLIVDPGIGFGKTLEHNLVLLANLAFFHGLGVPVLLGASRKRFIGTLSGVDDARQRMPGSVAAALMGAVQGVQIIRVHDVAATRQALSVAGAIQSHQGQFNGDFKN